MNAFRQRPDVDARPGRLVMGVALSLLVAVGCDLGLEESSNRYEQLTKETSQLSKLLQRVTDEESAQERLPEIQELGDRIRALQAKIIKSESDNPLGMPKATNVRQSQLYFQVASGVSRHIERINESDQKAGEMINKALEGIYWQ